MLVTGRGLTRSESVNHRSGENIKKEKERDMKEGTGMPEISAHYFKDEGVNRKYATT